MKRSIFILLALLVPGFCFAVPHVVFQAPFTGARTSDMTRSSTIMEYDGSVDGSGNLIDVSGNNYHTYSEDFTQWRTIASPTVVANDALAPNGTLTADRITVSSANKVYTSAYSGLPGGIGAKHVPSIWVKRVSTSGTFRIDSPGGYTYGRTLVDLATLPDTWVRIYPGSRYAVSTHEWASWSVVGAVGMALDSSSSDITLHVWGAQITDYGDNRSSLTAPPGIYLPTTSVIKPRLTLASTGSPVAVKAPLQDRGGNQVQGRGFDGATQYYSRAHDASMNVFDGDHTFTAMFVGTAGTADGAVFAKNAGGTGSGFLLLLKATTVEPRYLNAGGYIAVPISTDTTDGNLHVAQVVRSGNTATVYIDGVASTPVDISGYGIDGTSTINIGVSGSGGGKLNGSIYYTRLDSEALTVAELANDRNKLLGMATSEDKNPTTNAYKFNGSTDYLSRADGDGTCEPAGSFSVSIAVTFERLAGTLVLTGKAGTARCWYVVYDGATGAINFRVSNDGTTNFGHYSDTSAVVLFDTPMFITMTYEYITDGTSKMYYYQNNDATASNLAASGPPFNGTSQFVIGANNAGANPSKAKIHAMAFYDGVVLSEANHDAMYANFQRYGDPKHEDLGLTPTFYTRFDEDISGATITTPTGHVLTKNGSPVQVQVSPPDYGWDITRATSATMTTSTGVVVPVAAGMPRVGGPGGGLLVENAATNRMLRDIQISVWTKLGACSVTDNSTVSPDGTANASLVSGLGAYSVDSIYYSSVSGFTGSERIEPSFWLKRVTTSGVLNVQSPFGAALGEWTIDVSKLPNDWVRITRNNVQRYGSYVTLDWTASAGGNSGLHISTNDGPMSFYIWGVQIEKGTYPTSYIPTRGVLATRNQDIINIPVPESMRKTLDSGKVIVSFDAKLEFATPSTTQSEYLLSINNDGLIPGIIYIRTNWSPADSFEVFIFDQAGTARQIGYVNVVTAGIPLNQWNTYYLSLALENISLSSCSVSGVACTTTVATNAISLPYGATTRARMISNMYTNALVSASGEIRNLRIWVE